MDPVVWRGILALVLFVVVFGGSTYLLLSMILGPRLGYWVLASVWFGILVLLSAIWSGTALGPKGPETTWHVVAIGPDLSSVEGFGGTYDVSGYPEGDWEEPRKGGRLPGLDGDRDTRAEVANLKPVVEAFVSTAVSEIPGKREGVADQVQGSLEVKPGEFEVVDFRMKEAEVEGKPSIVSVGRVVPAADLEVETLGEGVKEGELERWLIKTGDEVSQGDAVMVVKSDGGSVEVEASASGKVLSLGLAKGDKVVAGVPAATLDVSGHPGEPTPAQVAAVRVLGSVRRPAFFYLVASLALFLVHLAGLSRAERARTAITKPATA